MMSNWASITQTYVMPWWTLGSSCLLNFCCNSCTAVFTDSIHVVQCRLLLDQIKCLSLLCKYLATFSIMGLLNHSNAPDKTRYHIKICIKIRFNELWFINCSQFKVAGSGVFIQAEVQGCLGKPGQTFSSACTCCSVSDWSLGGSVG